MHGHFDRHHITSCALKIDLSFCQTSESRRPLLSQSGDEHFHHSCPAIRFLLGYQQKNDCTLLSRYLLFGYKLDLCLQRCPDNSCNYLQFHFLRGTTEVARAAAKLISEPRRNPRLIQES